MVEELILFYCSVTKQYITIIQLIIKHRVGFQTDTTYINWLIINWHVTNLVESQESYIERTCAVGVSTYTMYVVRVSPECAMQCCTTIQYALLNEQAAVFLNEHHYFCARTRRRSTLDLWTMEPIH